MNLDLSGQIALVTGASRGIGQAIAQELSSCGATVIGTATTEAGAQAIAARLKPHGGSAKVLNVTDDAACESIMDGIVKEFGRIDILVNNAGITKDNLAMRMKGDEWSDVISTNLSSVFKLSQAVMRPMMKARSGRIINITSIVGHMGNAGQANYVASKAGIIGLTKTLSKEFGARGVNVNAIAPGFIQTKMTDNLPEDIKENYTNQIPLNRFGTSTDIANTVLFLASEKASYITGQVISVNGGMI